MLSPYDIIFAHVVLPDSISERKKVLEAMKAVVKRNHRSYAKIQNQLAALYQVEALQKELPLSFQEPPSTKTNPQGDGQ